MAGYIDQHKRVRHNLWLGPLESPVYTSDRNSFCLPCAQWFFGRDIDICPRCGAHIFRWVVKDDLKFFSSRSSLHGF
jgi:hypothetical protein